MADRGPIPTSAPYDGADDDALARRLGVPCARAFSVIGSTQDEAHRLAAEGAPAGTLVLADEQRSGRGRAGRSWTSAPGAGIWLSLIERPRDPRAIDVMSLRLGLAAADALQPFAPDAIRLKWPNDLYVGAGKLAGVLVEARWRDRAPEWVTIGIGINVRVPHDQPLAAALGGETNRLDVLAPLLPALRRAAARRGPLGEEELRAFAERDLALGRRCSAPAEGEVLGLAADGSLLVRGAAGVTACRGGSLIFEEANA